MLSLERNYGFCPKFIYCSIVTIKSKLDFDDLYLILKVIPTRKLILTEVYITFILFKNNDLANEKGSIFRLYNI